MNLLGVYGSSFVQKKTFEFRPIPSESTSDRILYHPLEEIKPIANTIAKIKHLMKERKAQIEKDHGHDVLKRTPFERKTLDTTTFYNKSQYAGDWNYLGIDGVGMYRYEDGTTYIGEFKDGHFSGLGVMRFPNGGIIKGKWTKGFLDEAQYIFKDGLIYSPDKWGYCKMPDRRFHSEIVDGLKPSGNIQMGTEHPAPYVWPGCFDTVEGFYRPKTKELINPITGEIIRIINKSEEKWILENCRRHGDFPFPFNPHIYENWFPLSAKRPKKLEKSKQIWNYLLNVKRRGLRANTEEPQKKLTNRGRTRCNLDNQPLYT